MEIKRFYATEDGNSAYDTVDLPLINRGDDGYGNAIATSAAWDSANVRVFEIEESAFQDWHNAPTRQLCVMLEGVWEVTTTDGRSARWKPGECFLPDDIQGKGHQSKVIEGPVRILFVPLPNALDLSNWT